MSQDKDPDSPAELSETREQIDLPADAGSTPPPGSPVAAGSPLVAGSPLAAGSTTDAEPVAGDAQAAGPAPSVRPVAGDAQAAGSAPSVGPVTAAAPSPRRPRDRPLPPEIEAQWTGTGSPGATPSTWTPSPHRIQDDFQRAPFFNASMLVMFMALAALFALGVYVAVSKYGLSSIFSR